MTAEEFREYGRQVVDWVADYWENIESRPVGARVEPGEIASALPAEAPEKGEPFSAVLADLDRVVMPGITHWQHPSFYAYFPANASGPAVLGDLLSSGLAVQGMLWATSPAVTEVETVVMDWLAKLLGLPERFLGSGVIQDTASSSVLCALVAALHRASGGAVRTAGIRERYAVYLSPESHSAGEKAVRIAGLGDAAIRVLDVDPSSLSVTADSLLAAVAADRAAGVTPLFVLATVGTTSTSAIDPVRALGEVCRAEGMWLHVDAAYAGSPRSAPSSAGSTTASSSPTRTPPTRTSGCSPTSTATRSGSPTRTRWSARSRCSRSSSATHRPSPARSSTTGTGRSRSVAGSGR
jgi:aromatic-L-amino-acid/L-tryptophan decarboxylase